MLLLIPIYLFLACCFLHILYWLTLFSRLKVDNAKSKEHNSPSVSVIVVFKNELENLKILVPYLLSQDYSNFDIILCDDFSTDDSWDYVQSQIDSKIKTLKATADLPGKKHALAEAIRSSGNDYVLLTDADCYPTSNQWINSMVSKLHTKKIVLGYSPHKKETGWLNRFIRFETYLVALQYFSYAIHGIPYMGVGRNLLYAKELFTRSNAIKDSAHLASGDDDLFINAESNKENTDINLKPESFIISYPQTTFSSFIRQKRRHMSTATAYKFDHQLLLALYALSHIGVYVLFVLGLFSWHFGYALVPFVITIFIKWAIASKTMKVLHTPDLIPFFPLLDLLMVCYYIFLTPATFIKTKNW